MPLLFGIFSVDPRVHDRVLDCPVLFSRIDTTFSRIRISEAHERVECTYDSKDQILCRDIALLTRFQTRWLRFI